jgi:quercetin dioxygenase-like cupin family protein
MRNAVRVALTFAATLFPSRAALAHELPGFSPASAQAAVDAGAGAVKILPPGEGAKLSVLGETILVRVAPQETAGRYAVIEEVSPPGGGTPPHQHANEDEVIYIVEGEAELMAGGKTVRAKVGSLALLPKGVPHQVRNGGEGTLRTMTFIVPGGFVNFFVDVDAKAKKGAVTPQDAAALGEPYGLKILPPPQGP